jgi:hypothetical protein
MNFQSLKIRLKSFAIGDFARDEEGVIAIEAMIILPMMFWTFMSLFSIFDAFQSYALNQKAAYTIGDAVSRETQPIDAAYLDGMWELFDFLALTREPSALRVTSLLYDGDKFVVDWSQNRGTVEQLDSETIGADANSISYWKGRLPVIPTGERVMLVETWDRYDPPFATGIEQTVIRNFVYTRPRYAPRVCWLECN